MDVGTERSEKETVGLSTLKDNRIFGVLCIIALCVLIECGLSLSSRTSEPRNLIKDGLHSETVVVDSCEYIFVSYGDHWGCLVHKGNCKNHAK